MHISISYLNIASGLEKFITILLFLYICFLFSFYFMFLFFLLSYTKGPDECIMNYNGRKETCDFIIIIVSRKTELPDFDSAPRVFLRTHSG